MSSKHKVADRVGQIHDYNVDLDGNQIFISGEPDIPTEELQEPGVEYRMASRFIRNLELTKSVNPDKPLVIHMKTCGGSWEEGMAMYDAIKFYPYPVIIISYTHARSMSSLLLQAADKRVLMPHSYFMLHDGTNGFEGTEKSFQSYAEFSKMAMKEMLNIYTQALHQQGLMKGASVKKIHSWLRNRMDKKEEVYLTAKQAVDLGFADEIFDGNWQKLREVTEAQINRER